MKAKFNEQELQTILKIAMASKSSNIETKVRNILNLSVAVETDNSWNNVTKRVIYYIAAAMSKDEPKMTRNTLKTLAQRIKFLFRSMGLKRDEESVKAIAQVFAKPTPTAIENISQYDLIAFRAVAEGKQIPRLPNVLDYLLAVIVVIFRFIDGRFGNRVLKPKARVCWRIVTYSITAYLIFRFIACPFFECWDKVVHFLNYVIWG